MVLEAVCVCARENVSNEHFHLYRAKFKTWAVATMRPEPSSIQVLRERRAHWESTLDSLFTRLYQSPSCNFLTKHFCVVCECQPNTTIQLSRSEQRLKGMTPEKQDPRTGFTHFPHEKMAAVCVCARGCVCESIVHTRIERNWRQDQCRRLGLNPLPLRFCEI